MRITALEADSRSGGVRIQLDGRPFGTVGIQDVADHGLTIDREIDEAASAALAKRAESFSARAVALRMLSTRSLREAAEKKARSLTGLDPAVAKRRLRAYLLRRGFSGGEVIAAIRKALG